MPVRLKPSYYGQGNLTLITRICRPEKFVRIEVSLALARKAALPGSGAEAQPSWNDTSWAVTQKTQQRRESSGGHDPFPVA